MDRGNLFDNLPADAPEEAFDRLAAGRTFHLERIVSTGQSTPPGEWLDQTDDEWVALLSGGATLRFGSEEFDLAPGDWFLIPAGTRHRVERTDPDRPTVWLALHLRR